MGDFNSRVGIIPGLEGNTPDTNMNTPMFLNFVSTTSMVIINTLPICKGVFTRFMDGSGRPGTKSVLDYGLVSSDHVHTFTSFVIDEEARFDAGSDHALLEVEITFGEKKHIQWSFQDAINYNFKQSSKYDDYQHNLDQQVASIPLSQFLHLPPEEMLAHVRETINDSGKKSFGVKVKKKKAGRKLPRNIIELIKAKNATSRFLQQAHAEFNILDIQILTLKV